MPSVEVAIKFVLPLIPTMTYVSFPKAMPLISGPVMFFAFQAPRVFVPVSTACADVKAEMRRSPIRAEVCLENNEVFMVAPIAGIIAL